MYVRPNIKRKLHDCGRVRTVSAGGTKPSIRELGWGVASLVAQTVKNLPAKPETWVQFLGAEDPLEEGMATHSSVLACESHGQRSLVGYRLIHRVTKSRT